MGHSSRVRLLRRAILYVLVGVRLCFEPNPFSLRRKNPPRTDKLVPGSLYAIWLDISDAYYTMIFVRRPHPFSC